jgi:hypothetical protein
MGRIVKPQSAADMGNVALTDDLFEGIHELLFSLPLLNPPQNGGLQNGDFKLSKVGLKLLVL